MTHRFFCRRAEKRTTVLHRAWAQVWSKRWYFCSDFCV